MQAPGAGQEAGAPAHVHDGQDQRQPGADPSREPAGQRRADRGDAGQVGERDDQAGGQPAHHGRRPGRDPGQAGQPGGQAGPGQRGGAGRGQVAEAGRLRVLADDDPPPAAVVEVLGGEGADAAAGPVGDVDLGDEPDHVAARPDAVVQLPVLRAEHLLVPPAGLLDGLPAVHAEVDGERRPGSAAGVERGRADPRLGGHPPRHGLLERGHALGRHDAAHVGGAGLGQRGHRGSQVARRQQRVPVDPRDDLVPRGAEGGVEGGRDPPARVGHDRDPRVGGGQVARDRLGPVGRGTDGEDQLERARVVLAEDVPDGLSQVPFLVPDRHHDGHGWVFHGARHGTAARGPSLLVRGRSPPASR
jgi:hypothetical protein